GRLRPVRRAGLHQAERASAAARGDGGAAGRGAVTLYVDLTTTWQEQGRHPHGTTRVERGIVAALARRDDPAIVFFRRDGAGYALASARDALAAATAPTQPELGREPQPGWWRHPLVMRVRTLRRRVRAALA